MIKPIFFLAFLILSAESYLVKFAKLPSYLTIGKTDEFYDFSNPALKFVFSRLLKMEEMVPFEDILPSNFRLSTSDVVESPNKIIIDTKLVGDVQKVLERYLKNYKNVPKINFENDEKEIQFTNGNVISLIPENYDNSLIVQIKEKENYRSKRETASTTTSTPSNHSVNAVTEFYTAEFPVMFNLILWLFLHLAMGIFVICYEMLSSNSGEDTILYKLTGIKAKKNQ
ncbi:hypothetical protein SNEBB_000729 [Seison nebaliae]|nr:hypothetical protein SNEBB_000729 [Seison nebaliae]